jgi:hypothetical protein
MRVMGADVRKEVWVVVGPDCPVVHEIEADTGCVHVTFGGGGDGADVVFAPSALARLAELARVVLAESDPRADRDGAP